MRPGVDADFVARHVLFAENIWAIVNTRADNEERGEEVLLRQEVKELSGYIEERRSASVSVGDENYDLL